MKAICSLLHQSQTYVLRNSEQLSESIAMRQNGRVLRSSTRASLTQRWARLGRARSSIQLVMVSVALRVQQNSCSTEVLLWNTVSIFQVSGPLFVKAIEGSQSDLGLVVVSSFIRRVVTLYKRKGFFSLASKRSMVAGLMAVSSARTVSVMVYSLWNARNAIFSRIKTKRRLPHMQVKGCPYRLQRLIERLRILFLAFALLSFPRTANDNRKSPTSYDPLDCFPPPGKQVQGIFTAIPRQ